MKKFELIPSDRDGMFRIKAVRDFADVKAGDIGGYVAHENNLSHEGDCWIYGEASVYHNARIEGRARVMEYAGVYDHAHVAGNARVSSIDDYIVFKNWWSSGRYFTWTRSDDMWSVGCFHGTGDELVAKAYKDSTLSGRENERCVRYVQALLDESE